MRRHYYLRNLKKIMGMKGVSQKELCLFLNVKQSTFSGWQTCRNGIDITNLTKIADYLQVSVNEIVGDETEDFPELKTPRFWFICDHRACLGECELCDGYTQNIYHAKNFRRNDQTGDYYET